MQSSNTDISRDESDDSTQRAHAWPGRVCIGLNYFFAVLLGIVYPYILLVAILDSTGNGRFASGEAFLIVAFILLAGYPYFLARGVSRFRRWSWWLVMITLPLEALSGILTLFDPTKKTGAVLVAGLLMLLDIIWMRYFWERRVSFGVHLRGKGEHPPV